MIMEKSSTQEAALLLEHVSGIIKNYDNLYRSKGLKYNIFKIARISEKEVIICRVIADLLNPKGTHYKGDAYLKLFWDIVSPKIKDCPKLKTENARVINEYSTDVKRRIDIVIEDGAVFIPIEVKIWAGEQENQIKDYAEYSRIKNAGIHIPVLCLTIRGNESETADAGDYVCVSFCEDILAWLSKCLAHPETEATPPVREILKQLIETVKSICEYTEDEEMGEAIKSLITQSEETIRAALAISAALEEFDDESSEFFKGIILENVQKELPNAVWEENKEEEWWAISVPIRNDTYVFSITYDWKWIGIWPKSEKKSNSAEEKKLAKKMSELIGTANGEWNEDAVWVSEEARYPGLEYADASLYPYERYKQYAEHPQEVARKIVSMVHELEKA
jgi:hypothetical protein